MNREEVQRGATMGASVDSGTQSTGFWHRARSVKTRSPGEDGKIRRMSRAYGTEW
jgi:hypothetical protein